MMMEGITDGMANDFYPDPLQSVNFCSDDSDTDIEGAYSDGGNNAKRKKRKTSTDILDRRSVYLLQWQRVEIHVSSYLFLI